MAFKFGGLKSSQLLQHAGEEKKKNKIKTKVYETGIACH